MRGAETRDALTVVLNPVGKLVDTYSCPRTALEKIKSSGSTAAREKRREHTVKLETAKSRRKSFWRWRTASIAGCRVAVNRNRTYSAEFCFVFLPNEENLQASKLLTFQVIVLSIANGDACHAYEWNSWGSGQVNMIQPSSSAENSFVNSQARWLTTVTGLTC